MKKFRAFLLIGWLCLPAFGQTESAVQWSRLGYQFEASSSLYKDQRQLLNTASTEIADVISNIQTDKLPSEIRAKFVGKKVVFLFEKSAATDAVFFPPHTKRESDEDEYIITLNPALIGNQQYLRIISHEFFHAIHFAINPNEVSWVREGMAQLFEHMLYDGFNFAHVNAGLTKSDFPLESEFNPDNYVPEKYGNTLLYFYYLTIHCSQDESLFWSMVSEGNKGRSTIDVALKTINTKQTVCKDFSSSALGFSLAKMMNTYSGHEQSSSTFILPSSEYLKVDLASEKKVLSNTQEFWKNYSSYRPLRLSVQGALKLSINSPQNARWFALEKNYPNRVKAIGNKDLSTISSSFEIGLVLVD